MASESSDRWPSTPVLTFPNSLPRPPFSIKFWVEKWLEIAACSKVILNEIFAAVLVVFTFMVLLNGSKAVLFSSALPSLLQSPLIKFSAIAMKMAPFPPFQMLSRWFEWNCHWHAFLQGVDVTAMAKVWTSVSRAWEQCVLTSPRELALSTRFWTSSWAEKTLAPEMHSERGRGLSYRLRCPCSSWSGTGWRVALP